MENIAPVMKLLFATFRPSLTSYSDSEKLVMLCLSTEELFLLNQESANFIHKEPDNKHLRLYGP